MLMLVRVAMRRSDSFSSWRIIIVAKIEDWAYRSGGLGIPIMKYLNAGKLLFPPQRSMMCGIDHSVQCHAEFSC